MGSDAVVLAEDCAVSIIWVMAVGERGLRLHRAIRPCRPFSLRCDNVERCQSGAD